MANRLNLILLAGLLAASCPALASDEHAAHQAAHTDQGVHASHQAASDAAMPAYIRATAPTGRQVVIGRSNPLREAPAKTYRDAQGQAVREFELTVRDVPFEIFPGKMMHGWGFNGQIPGPTLRVQEGERVRIVLNNVTDDEHSIHVHGQKKPVAMDGVPYLSQEPVKKGESYVYEFIANNPGTHWYHCHVDSAHHVDMGMAGAFIVEPRKETLEFDREYTLILDEWDTGHQHTAHHDHAAAASEHAGHTGHDASDQAMEEVLYRDWYPKTYQRYEATYDGFTINGRSFPYTEPLDVEEGERVRIRLINAGYQDHYMHTHSHKFRVVARDGSPVNEPQQIDTVHVGPGQRIDIVLIADNPGIWPFHCHRINHIANDKVYPGGMLTFIRYVELESLFD